ncbi:helix-turn-helix domain-containing protein [Lutibacter sp. B2]|nr:helix-turn-helix domain-containing protein [Lutibacter sp. B2]
MINYVFFFIGIIIVTISFFMLKKDENFDETINLHMIESENEKLLNNMKAAKEIGEELNNIGENVMNNLNHKFEYMEDTIKLIDEKIEYLNLQVDLEYKNKDDKKVDYDEVKEDVKIYLDEKDREINEILTLYKEGYSVADIAKSKKKGIREIQLICDMKKR